MMSDPFAAPPPGGGGMHPMDRAFAGAPGVARTVPDDDIVMGVPKGLPKWLVPAIIGALAVLAGVIGAVLFLR